MSCFLKWLKGETNVENPNRAEDGDMDEQLHVSVESHKHATLKLKRSSLNHIEDAVRAHELLESALERITARELKSNERGNQK